MENERVVAYSIRSGRDLQEIIAFLRKVWTEREVKSLKSALLKFERHVRQFPDMYPVVFPEMEIRRAVLLRKVSVFYAVETNRIVVLSILDSRQDPNRLSHFR